MNEHTRTITASALEPQMRLLSPAYYGTFVDKTRKLINQHGDALGLALSVSSRLTGDQITHHAVRIEIVTREGKHRFIIVLEVAAAVATVNQAIFMAVIELETWLEVVGLADVSDFLFDKTKPAMSDLATYGITPEDEVAHMLAVVAADPDYPGSGR